MAMTPPPNLLRKEATVTPAEMETLVVEVTRDAAAGTHANGATTVGEWDISPACVGNQEEVLKAKDHREAAAEAAAEAAVEAAAAHLFQAWMVWLGVPLHVQTNRTSERYPTVPKLSGVDFAAHGARTIVPLIRRRKKREMMVLQRGKVMLR